MARKSAQELAPAAWALARRQHWVVTRQQLLGLGFSPEAIDYRLADARLHTAYAGIYVVGRPDLTRDGQFMAAVLASGEGAALSDHSAAEHFTIMSRRGGPIHVTVRRGHPRRPGIQAHRRSAFETTQHRGIRVTTVVCTIVQLAARVTEAELERTINEAVNRDLTDPDRLRGAVAEMCGRKGSGRVLRLLDRDTYVVTDSRLEQRFLRIVRRAGLPLPTAQRQLEGGRVDFHWPQLGLIVEADSLRYHRTPAQQRADRLRDQKHAAAGLNTLRFTHWQIFFDAGHVEAILRQVVERLQRAAA